MWILKTRGAVSLSFDFFGNLADNNAMVITYYGGDCFRVQFGDTVVAVNPTSKDSKLKTVRFGADIVLSAANLPDYNGVEQVQGGGKDPFVIDGPGEYEVGGVVVKGYPAPGAVPRHTFFFLTLEGMNLCFLTGLTQTELSREMQEELGEVDILFVPIGGGSLPPGEVYKVAVGLEPSYIIPMHYDPSTKEGKESLRTFLKEGGAENAKSQEKLTLKRRDVDTNEGKIEVLSPVTQ